MIGSKLNKQRTWYQPEMDQGIDHKNLIVGVVVIFCAKGATRHPQKFLPTKFNTKYKKRLTLKFFGCMVCTMYHHAHLFDVCLKNSITIPAHISSFQANIIHFSQVRFHVNF